MSYFQERLQHNRLRFNELTAEDVLFTHLTNEPLPIVASPIFKRSFIVQTMASQMRAERLWWAYDLTQAEVEIPIANMGDLITTADGYVYRVQQEENGDSHFQYLTSSHNRVMVYTVMQTKPE
jgi:hypothetical protein